MSLLVPKQPRITAVEAERMLLTAGFALIRSKGSHRIYSKDDLRFVLPYHAGTILHPKIVRDLLSILAP